MASKVDEIRVLLFTRIFTDFVDPLCFIEKIIYGMIRNVVVDLP